MKKIKLILAPLLLVLVLASCGKEKLEPGGSGLSQNTKQKQAGSPAYPGTVSITSSPCINSDDCDNMIVVIDKVEAFLEDGSCVTLNSRSQTLNLADIEDGKEQVIAAMTQTEASLLVAIKLSLEVENYQIESGIPGIFETNLNSEQNQEVTIEIDQGETLPAPSVHKNNFLLNLDLQNSLNLNSSNEFQAVVTFIADSETGIKGRVEGVNQAMITVRNENESYQTFLTASGQFMIRDMEAGTYDVFIEALSDELNLLSDKTISGLTVVDGHITTTQEIIFKL